MILSKSSVDRGMFHGQIFQVCYKVVRYYYYYYFIQKIIIIIILTCSFFLVYLRCIFNQVSSSILSCWSFFSYSFSFSRTDVYFFYYLFVLYGQNNMVCLVVSKLCPKKKHRHQPFN